MIGFNGLDCSQPMNKPYKKLLVLVFLAGFIILFCSIVFAENSTPNKNKDILKLLEVSGILEQMDYIKAEVTNSYARAISLTYPKVPDPFWDDLNKLLGKKEIKVLLDRVTLVYDKHMSHEVIKQLIKMFSTPFWDEWKHKMPAISKEAGAIGSEWTQELLQSQSFKKKLDNLVSKYDLEKLNSSPEKSNSKN